MFQAKNNNLFKTYLKHSLQNSGAVMIFVIMLSFIASLIVGSMSLSNRYSLKLSGRNRQKVQAFFVAEAGKERTITKLRHRELNPDANTKVNVFDNIWLDSAGTYTVTCSTNAANNRAWLRSTGKTVTDSVVLEVVVTLGPSGGSGFGWVRGALTAKPRIETKGNAVIDGRDYDTIGTTDGAPGTLITGATGIYGIATGDTVKVTGSSEVGGVTTAPNQPAPAGTIKEYMDLTDYPTTPEEVLGLPANSLDTYKCTTCPPKSYYGIVYQEDPKQNGLCEFAGGILIVHNDAGTASLKNYHLDDFNGLIIADNVNHFNAGSSVLGAIVMLGDAFNGEFTANGHTRIYYSSIALRRAFSLDVFPPPSKRDVTIESWREIN